MSNNATLFVSPQLLYERAASDYDSWIWQQLWQRWEAPIVADWVSEYRSQFSSEATLVDVGCGTGEYMAALACDFQRSVGIDPSGAMLEISRQKCRSLNSTWIESSLEEGHLDSTASLLLCTRVLHHVSDAGAFLGKCRSMLRDDGVMVFSTISPDHSYESFRIGRLRALAPQWPERTIAWMERALEDARFKVRAFEKVKLPFYATKGESDLMLWKLTGS